MKSTYTTLALLMALPLSALAQASGETLNLNFEQLDSRTKLPTGWWAPAGNSYRVATDSVVRHEGRYALRIESVGTRRAEGKFGVATLKVPLAFRGKTIKLTGFLKTENVQGGYAGLWLRVDGKQAMQKLDNMSRQNIHGTTDWQAYTIVLPLDENSESVLLGGIMPATGAMWLDQLTLTVDDKPLTQAPSGAVAATSAPAKVVQRFKAEQDTAFRRGSGISLDKLSKQQIENLAVLGRVWGFAKYYHPAIARGDYNWDAELLRVLPRVLEAKNQSGRSRVLGSWLSSLGVVPACATCFEPAADSIRLRADLAWLTDKKQVSAELSQQLEYLRQNRNQGPHYYVRSAPNIGNPLFEHEEAYASPATPDAGLRLLALYRYWNMIAYFFPYRYAIGEDWQRVLPEFIPQFAAARTDEQYRLVALALIARIHDTHANIFGNDKVLAAHWGKLYAPVRIRFVEGQAVVTDYYNPTLGKETGLQIGDVLVKIDGVPVPQLVKKLRAYAPASNEPTQLRVMATVLLRGNSEPLPLVISRNGKKQALTITRTTPDKLNLAMNNGTADPKAPAWRMLPNNIGYLALGTIKGADIPQIMAAAKGTKGMVIDMRNYPSDFVVFSLTQHLLPKSAEFVRFSEGQVTYPGMFRHTPALTLPARGNEAYPGKVVILINEISQSQSEYTTMALRTAPRATVVGSTTAGADGNVSTIVLPGNIVTRISGIGVYYPDGRETQRVGIVPDVEVKPTIQGIREGRDELLEKAVQLIEAG